MFPEKKASEVLILAILLLLVASCGTRTMSPIIKLEPPGAIQQTILVLPVQVTNTTERTRRHGFYYIYEIVNKDDADITHEAIFKLPLRGDILIVDSLPPGDYSVDKFIFKTIGTGDFSYGNNVFPRNDRFKLEAGKITIFSKSLNVSLYNKIPGRGSETTYNFNMVSMPLDQRQEVLTELRKLPNIDAWEILGEKAGGTSSSQVRRQHKKFVAAEKFRGAWSGIWRPVTEADTENCNEGRLSFDIDGTRLSGEGTDSMDNRYRISASLIDDGVIRGKLSLDRTRRAKVTGKLYDDGTILGSFTYDNNCIAEWKARKY